MQTSLFFSAVLPADDAAGQRAGVLSVSDDGRAVDQHVFDALGIHRGVQHVLVGLQAVPVDDQDVRLLAGRQCAALLEMQNSAGRPVSL